MATWKATAEDLVAIKGNSEASKEGPYCLERVKQSEVLEVQKRALQFQKAILREGRVRKGMVWAEPLGKTEG